MSRKFSNRNRNVVKASLTGFTVWLSLFYPGLKSGAMTRPSRWDFFSFRILSPKLLSKQKNLQISIFIFNQKNLF
jgi:hypothetical protein